MSGVMKIGVGDISEPFQAHTPKEIFPVRNLPGVDLIDIPAAMFP